MDDIRVADVVLAIYVGLVIAAAVYALIRVYHPRSDNSFAALPLVVVAFPASLVTTYLIAVMNKRFPEAWTRSGYALGLTVVYVVTGLVQAVVLWFFT